MIDPQEVAAAGTLAFTLAVVWVALFSKIAPILKILKMRTRGVRQREGGSRSRIRAALTRARLRTAGGVSPRAVARVRNIERVSVGAVALAALIVLSAIAPVAAVGLAGASAPDGMRSVPDGNIGASNRVTTPVDGLMGGGTLTSAHADSLEVTVTTPQHASQLMGTDVDRGRSSGDALAFVLRDDENHEGRRIAFDSETLTKILGYRPEAVYGTHDDGREWMAPAEYSEGYLVVKVPDDVGFSTNTVTFSGEVEISGARADGSSSSYSLSGVDSVDNFSIDVTGNPATEWDNETAGGVSGSQITTADSTTDWGSGSNVDITAVSGGSDGTAIKGTAIDPSQSGNRYMSYNPSGTWDFRGDELTFWYKTNNTGGSHYIKVVDGSGSADSYTLSPTTAGAYQTVDLTNPDDGTIDADLSDADQVQLVFDGPSGEGKESTIDDLNTGDPVVPLSVAGDLEPTGPSANGQPVVEFTGVRTENWRNESASISAGDTFPIETNGTDVIGPSASNEATITASGSTLSASNGGGYDFTFALFDSSAGHDAGIQLPNGEVDRIHFDNNKGDGDVSNCDIYLTTEASDGDATDGTLVKSGYNPPDNQYGFTVSGLDWETGGASTGSVGVTCGGSSNIPIREDSAGGTDNLKTDGSEGRVLSTAYNDADPITVNNGSGGSVTLDPGTGSQTKEFALDPGISGVSTSGDPGPFDLSVEKQHVHQTDSPALDLGNDGSTEASVSGLMADGETATRELSELTTSSSAAKVSVGSTVDVTVKFRERSATKDPSVTVNGHATDYTGTVSDGSTISLSSNTSWLNKDGSNTVEFGLASAPSADAPARSMSIDYHHSAADQISVNTDMEQLSVRYNVSRTYSSDRANAELSVPFDTTVYAARTVELRENGGAWSELSASSYSLNDSSNTLTVDVSAATSVDAGDEIGLRINASRVDVKNGEISVTDPSLPGEELDSEIQLETWESSSRIILRDERVPFFASESWSGAAEYALVDSSGPALYAPNAPAGSSARIERLPIKARTEGDVRLEPVSTDATPAFKVSEGPTEGDSVEFVVTDASTGEKYILWSKTNEVVRDSDTAESPAYLSDDDSSETLEIKLDDGSSSSTGGGAVFAGVGGGGGISADLSGPLLAISLFAGLGILLVIRSKFDVSLPGMGGSASSASSASSSRKAASAVGSAGSSVAGALERSARSIPALGRVFGPLVSAVNRALAGVGRAIGSALGSVGSRIVALFRDPLILLTVLLAGAIGLYRATSIQIVPRETWTLIVLVGLLLLSYVALRRFGQFSWPIFGVIAGALFVLATELISEGSPLLGPLGEGLGRFAPLALFGLLYLGKKWLDSRNRDVNLSLSGVRQR